MSFKIQIGILFFMLTNIVFGQNIEVVHLKTDRQTTPLGFDNSTPEFSWIMHSSDRGTARTAYAILVSDDKAKLDDGRLWQTGKITSNQNFGVRYAGKPLKSFTRYFWKVRTWNQKGEASEWSEPS